MKADTPKYTAHRRLREEMRGTLLGVEGRWLPLDVFDTTAVGTFHRQKFISDRRTRTVDGEKLVVEVEVRFDDNCKNGHNSFAITGTGWYDHYKARDCDFCGACHDTIEKVFPELAHLIQWHLFDSNGPMHYIANTVYHATNLDCGKAKGEPNAWATRVQLGNWPITLDLKREFREWLLAAIEHRRVATSQNPHRKLFNIVAVPHVNKPGDTYQFSPHYSFDDYTTDWYKAPFSTKQEAEEFKAALAAVGDDVKEVKVVTGYSGGKERNLDAARRCANWPEATDEQLCLPEAELTALLLERLPAMMEKFRADLKAAGFYWSPEDMS